MTNPDTNTLNGALEQLGITMAANLTQQGVTSSASEGLTTLAGKILDIQTGGGSCYHIEFEENSYIASGGSVTVSVYLQSNYAPLSGATVTFTGTGVNTTATTDSNGIATKTITGLSSALTLTASYSNVSDTCNVTVGPSVLFQPALDGTETKYTITGSTTISGGVMSGGASYLTGGWDNTGNWVCTFEAKIPNDRAAISLYAHGVTQRDKNEIKITGNYHKNITSYTNGSSESTQGTTVPVDTWFNISLTKNGNTLTAVLNNNTYTVTWSQLTTLSEVHLGTDSWGASASIRNIKVEPL